MIEEDAEPKLWHISIDGVALCHVASVCMVVDGMGCNLQYPMAVKRLLWLCCVRFSLIAENARASVSDAVRLMSVSACFGETESCIACQLLDET